jgi:hypothetical protein
VGPVGQYHIYPRRQLRTETCGTGTPWILHGGCTNLAAVLTGGLISTSQGPRYRIKTASCDALPRARTRLPKLTPGILGPNPPSFRRTDFAMVHISRSSVPLLPPPSDPSTSIEQSGEGERVRTPCADLPQAHEVGRNGLGSLLASGDFAVEPWGGCGSGRVEITGAARAPGRRTPSRAGNSHNAAA